VALEMKTFYRDICLNIWGNNTIFDVFISFESF
jgi:hypothetical protein